MDQPQPHPAIPASPHSYTAVATNSAVLDSTAQHNFDHFVAQQQPGQAQQQQQQNVDNNSSSNNADRPRSQQVKRPMTSEELEHYLDTRPTGVGPFIRNPLGRMYAPCGEDNCVFAYASPWSWCCIGTAVLLPAVFFIIWVPDADEIWSRVIVGVLAFACLTLMFLGGCSDPGIVLPKRVDAPDEQAEILEVPHVGQVTVEVCTTCKVLRPPRSSHCRISGVCVAGYDHFCGVVGSVVAERTFRYFTLQLVMYCVFAAFIAIRCIVIAASGVSLTDGHGGVWRAILTYGLIVIGALVTCCVSGVAGHYVHLSGTGMTLKDERGRKKFVDPEDTNWSCSRCLSRLFGEMPKSNLYAGMQYVKDEADQL